MSRSRAASLAAIFLVVFIDLLGFGIVLPLLARYGEYLRADAVTIGALVASFSAMQFLFAPLWGKLSDRIGRRPVLLVGLLGSAAFYALFGVATGVGPGGTLFGLSPLVLLFVSRTGAGIAGATIPTAQAYIADVTGAADRSKGMALIGAAFGIGFTFGPMLGAIFVSGDPDAGPSPYPGYLAAGLSAAAFLTAAAVLKEPERHADRSATRPAGRWGLLGDSVRLALVGEIFFATAAFALFESTLSLLSQRLGYADRQNYFLFGFVGLTLAFAQGVFVRRVAPRWREKRMAPLGLTLMALGLAALTAVGAGMAGAGVPLYGSLAVCTVGFAFLNPSLQALLSFTASDREQGAVLGLGQSASALARIVGQFGGIALFGISVPLPYGAAALIMTGSLAAIFPVLAVVKRHAEWQTEAGREDLAVPVVME